jgi:hypothetical protein
VRAEEDRQAKEESSFFEKKKQKNFIRLEPALPTDGRQVSKVFLLLFFQKKEDSSFCDPLA